MPADDPDHIADNLRAYIAGFSPHVSNLEMGYLYEELIRRFSELSNETAGEHFTPRERARRRRCTTRRVAPVAC